MKIGDKVKILEIAESRKRYVMCEIIQIIKKKVYKNKYYNMYVCKNLKSKVKVTFTDKDLNLNTVEVI